MFPWLIWLCMAGTAKDTVPSPLPSDAYIRLTGISHFHRYYGAIRLPTTLLRPSFRCVRIPRFTRFLGRCRLSPVAPIALYSMNWSPTPPQVHRLAVTACSSVAFHVVNRVGLRDLTGFGALYSPYYLAPHALQITFPLSAQGLLLVV